MCVLFKHRFVETYHIFIGLITTFLFNCKKFSSQYIFYHVFFPVTKFFFQICREVLRLRGVISRTQQWSVQVDLFLYHDMEHDTERDTSKNATENTQSDKKLSTNEMGSDQSHSSGGVTEQVNLTSERPAVLDPTVPEINVSSQLMNPMPTVAVPSQ